MTNIEQDSQRIGEIGLNAFENELYHQSIELEKKRHLIRASIFLNSLEDSVKNLYEEVPEEEKIVFNLRFKVKRGLNYDSFDIYESEVLDNYDKKVIAENFCEKQYKIINDIKMLIDNSLHSMKESSVSNSINEIDECTVLLLPLDNTLKEELLNIILSEELKVMYNFISMSQTIPSQNKEGNSRKKI